MCIDVGNGVTATQYMSPTVPPGDQVVPTRLNLDVQATFSSSSCASSSADSQQYIPPTRGSAVGKRTYPPAGNMSKKSRGNNMQG